MTFGVGAALRHERLRREMSLADISAQTRISERLLKAIENEDFGQLPGIIFTRNFVRQYAAALGLDPNPLVAQLPKVDIEEATLPSAPAPERRQAWDPRWNSAFSMAAWVVLACGAAVAAYVHFNRPAETHANNAPVQQAPPQPAPAATAAPAEPVKPEEDIPAAAPAPDTDKHPVQVLLTAKEESWVQVTADGEVAFTATMQPNETKSVSADTQIKVVTGNAGGLAISLNGKPLDSLGPSGQVRTVRLTAEGPQVAQKTPQPPPPDPL